jgi:hypothetical protein
MWMSSGSHRCASAITLQSFCLNPALVMVFGVAFGFGAGMVMSSRGLKGAETP